MENTGWKGLATTLWQRVILSYKSTLIGIGIEVACVAAENFTHSSNHTLAIVGGVAMSALALYKSPKLAPKPE